MSFFMYCLSLFTLISIHHTATPVIYPLSLHDALPICADVITGIWEDGRMGIFRGQRAGKPTYGGYVYGEKSNMDLGPYQGYLPLLVDIAQYFETGQTPVTPEETLEIFA